MDVGSIFLILALFFLTAIFVTRPLMENTAIAVSEDEQHRSALLAERERLLNALLELDFDHELGKVAEEIYPQQRQNLMQRGAEVLRQLDAIQENAAEQDADIALEAAIAARRAKIERTDGDDLEAKIAARRVERVESAPRPGGQARFCPQCGEGVQPGDKFCVHCGANLT